LRPLRERDFALLWTGMTVSLLGDGVFVVATAWQVYDLDNDPVALSAVGTAWALGMVAFLLTGGVVTDRVDRRRVMIAADLVRTVAVAAIGVLSVTGAIAIWHLVALSLLMGAAEAFFGPAFGAIVPDVVAREHLVQANALDQLVSQAATRLAGPALGGIVVAAVGPGAAFLGDAGTFAVSAACVAAMGLRMVPVETARSARRELVEGLRYVRGEPWLWATLISASLSLLFFVGPIEVLLPYVVRNGLHAGAGGYGAVLARPASAPWRSRCCSARRACRGATSRSCTSRGASPPCRSSSMPSARPCGSSPPSRCSRARAWRPAASCGAR